MRTRLTVKKGKRQYLDVRSDEHSDAQAEVIEGIRRHGIVEFVPQVPQASDKLFAQNVLANRVHSGADVRLVSGDELGVLRPQKDGGHASQDHGKQRETSAMHDGSSGAHRDEYVVPCCCIGELNLYAPRHREVMLNI